MIECTFKALEALGAATITAQEEVLLGEEAEIVGHFQALEAPSYFPYLAVPSFTWRTDANTSSLRHDR